MGRLPKIVRRATLTGLLAALVIVWLTACGDSPDGASPGSLPVERVANAPIAAPAQTSTLAPLQTSTAIPLAMSTPTPAVKRDSPDRAALIALYDATDGPNWTNSDNWLSDAPLWEWRGVVTDADGRVTELFLGNNGLTGAIPSELGQLAYLKELDLWKQPEWGYPKRSGTAFQLGVASDR